MIDWERLKAVYLDNSAGSECTAWALYDAFPEILAQHEQDQRVIEAAKKLRAILYRRNPLVAEAIEEFDKVVKP